MRLLMICKDVNYRNFLSKKLSSATVDCLQCDNLDAALGQLKQNNFDGVICCLPLCDQSCPFSILADLQNAAINTGIIFIADQLEVHLAMSLMRQGAFCCFNRPFPLEKLQEVIQKLKKEAPAIDESRKTSVAENRVNIAPAKHVIGNSKEALKMYRQIELVGPTNFNVIIYGETGTGKESVAYMLANAGDQGNKERNIAVDCGCLSKELALSELFGHEKGSFTGAVGQKTGAFELANNGTLFLDEIGNLDYEVQGYLLRAIQEKKIRRVGGTQEIAIQTRIIVASNENLAEAVQKGTFREDLYHRLNEFEIVVPPLRARATDLPLFIDYFINETNKELGKQVLSPDTEALLMLQCYNWPGNIRELRNIIRRACLLCRDGQALKSEHLPVKILNYMNERKLNFSTGVELPVPVTPVKAREVTLNKIKEILRMVNYNKTKAARLLGIDRKTLYNRLKSISFPGNNHRRGTYADC
ncbi:MAG: sigma-54-dependent Fis family transcriptional regulator [Taibaiella sp.]|nr:sigma-54-dependent Fis family transcriptional regulator [Taibaiella sp.]